MSDVQTGAGGRPERFLVGGARVKDALRVADDDPEITILDVKGDFERPSAIVLEMTQEQARALLDRFASGELIVERDLPLSFPGS